MPSAITRYRCRICGHEYRREDAAALCESFAVVERPVPIGSRLAFTTRDRDTEDAVVVGYLDKPHPYMCHADAWPDERYDEFKDTVDRLGREHGDKTHRLDFKLDEALHLDHKWESDYDEIPVDICYGWKVLESATPVAAVDPHADSTGTPSTRVAESSSSDPASPSLHRQEHEEDVSTRGRTGS